jgi:hypothetical protein
LKDTVQEGRESSNIPYIHGLNHPKPGLDTWIFNNFIFGIQEKEGGLVLDVTSNKFRTHGFPISSRKIENVGEGIALYEENIVDNSIIQNLCKGILIKAGISKYADLKIKEENLFELANGKITEKFLDKYRNALEILNPFNISEESKKSLFISMLLEIFHTKDL